MKSLVVPVEKNVKISQKIVDQIKEIIFSGGLQPGDRLPTEKELAQNLNVSRPTLREALIVLEAIGLIEVRPREGSIVKSVVPQSIQDPIQDMIHVDPYKVLELFEVRKIVDSEGAAMAAERATDEELAGIRGLAETLAANVAEQRTILDLEVAKLYQKTFFAMADATHNSIYAHFMKSVWSLLAGALPYSRQKLLNVPNISSKLVRQYNQIVGAVLDRKPAASRKAVMAHLDFVGRQLEALIAAEQRTDRPVQEE